MGREWKGFLLPGKCMSATLSCCSEHVSGQGAGRFNSCHPLSDCCQTAVVFTAERSDSVYS